MIGFITPFIPDANEPSARSTSLEHVAYPLNDFWCMQAVHHQWSTHVPTRVGYHRTVKSPVILTGSIHSPVILENKVPSPTVQSSGGSSVEVPPEISVPGGHACNACSISAISR